jgi:hypothetical protein
MHFWAKLAIAVAVAALVVSSAAQSFAADASLDSRRQALLLARPNDLALPRLPEFVEPAHYLRTASRRSDMVRF